MTGKTIADDAKRKEWRELAHWELCGYYDAKKEIATAQLEYEAIQTKCQRMVGNVRSVPSGITVRENRIDVPGAILIDVKQQGDLKKVEELLSILADQGNVVRQRQVEAEQRCATLAAMIQARTSGMHARILSAYYLYNRTLAQIAASEHISYAHAKRLRWRALEEYGRKSAGQ